MKKQETKKEVKQVKCQACLLFDSDKKCANCKKYTGSKCIIDDKYYGPEHYCPYFYPVW